jgi:peptidoglycan/xylan/chitin deacetylase (PgdA/CDA1 family)
MTRHLDRPRQADGGVLPLRRVPFVLMYHRVAGVAVDPNSLAVSPRRFTDQMAWLKRRGLRGVAVRELVAALRVGTGRGMVGITFDDGYADLVDVVPAVLRRFGFTATVFVVSGRIGGVNDWDRDTPWPLLDADGVRHLAGAGLEIGSHGRSHRPLAGMAAAALREETRDSRRDLAALIGSPVDGFAYPYGSIDAAARAEVRRAGYTYACGVFAARREQTLLGLPRSYVGGRDTGLRLAAKRLLYRWHVSTGGGTR